MIAARKRIGARNPHRDATMILLAYRHGLRASELCSLRWDMLDLSHGRYHVTRRKNGRPSVHLLRGTEIRALRRLQREQVPASIYVFATERRGPMTPATFRKLLTTIGAAAELPFPAHPHMLRHACATSSRTTGTTPAPCRSGSGTPTSRTRPGTPSSPAGGSRISGSKRIRFAPAKVTSAGPRPRGTLLRRHDPMAWPTSANGLARRADDARPRLDPHVGEPFVGGDG